VYGPNETGKSTLFNLLTSMLYGFSPASKERHPYTPWDDDLSPDFEAELVLRDGQTVKVSRRLLSAPRGMLVRGEAVEDIANRPLPFVQHVNRDLYQALYALTAYNFHNLKEDQQAEIQDRLLGGFATTRFRSVSRVLQELERDANQLWRPDRRRTKCSALQEELRQLRGRRQEAVEKEADLQQKLVTLRELQDQRGLLEQERAELKGLIRQAETLVLLASALKQLEEWRQDIGDEKRLAALPLDIRGELAGRRQRLVEQEAELDDIREQMNDAAAVIAAFGRRERLVLDRAGDIREWVRRAEAHDQDGQAINSYGEEAELHWERLSELAAEILVEPWSEDLADPVTRVAPAELKARIINCMDNRESLRLCQEARLHKEHNAPPVARSVPLWLGLGFGLAGLLIGGLGWLGASVVLQAAGVTATVVAAGMLVLGWVTGQASRQLDEHYRAELRRLDDEERVAFQMLEKSREQVLSILKPLPVATGLLERPDMSLYESVVKLRGEVLELDRIRQRQAEKQEKWTAARSRLDTLVNELGETLGEWAGPVVDRLAERLAACERAKTAHDSATDRLTSLQTQEQYAESELARLRNEKTQLEEEIRAVAGLPDGVDTAVDMSVVLEEALIRVAGLQKTRDLLEHHEAELQKKYVDLENLQEEIRSLGEDEKSAWVLDRTEVELTKNRLEELDEQHRDLVERIAKLDSEVQSQMQGPSPGELDGKLAAMEEDRQAMERERDRLALMRLVLQRAERLFRERHQPDVLRRGGAYLNLITGGRYTRLMMLANEDGSEKLVVQRGDRADPIAVEHPLSRGTLDQIFLAFRLAVIDHLDEGHEALPLFLDEGLVNWDDVRLENGVRLFGDIAEVRQVFLFTCRNALAELISTRLASPIITMPDVG
jgi:uncharacterized protein YhaN